MEAVELGRPDGTDDAITYDGLEVFTTPAADLITQLRQRTTVHQEEDASAFSAPSLLLSLRRLITPQSPHDQEGRFFDSVLIAQPGYYDQPGGPEPRTINPQVSTIAPTVSATCQGACR